MAGALKQAEAESLVGAVRQELDPVPRSAARVHIAVPEKQSSASIG